MSSKKSAMIDVGSNRQVFIDGSLIENGYGVEIKVHKPKKTGEINIIRENQSHHRIGGYNSVLYDDGQYKMWYSENIYASEGIYICVCYAHSSDGINWEKPNLGLANKFKEKNNNIVLGFGAGGTQGGLGDPGCMVFLDPNSSPDQKYKMVARPGLHEELNLFCSPDGIHWSMLKEKIFDDGRKRNSEGEVIGGFHLDSQNIILWDDRIQKYVSYVRKNYEVDGQCRTIARSESSNLFSFPEVEKMDVILQPDQLDMPVKIKGFCNPIPIVDYYTNAAIKYPWAENAYYMFPSLYYKYGHHLSEFKEEVPLNAGPIDIRFGASRDGIRWERFDRSPYVRLGRKVDFDAYSQYMVHGLVPGQDDEMYMYYLGNDQMHGWNRGDHHEERGNRLLKKAGFDSKRDISAIGRLVLRRDGFISVRGAYTGGRFTTPVMCFDGNVLEINVDTSAAGALKVGIMDERNCFIEGYGLSECNCIHTTNDINKTVSWNNKQDIKHLIGKPVKLHFELYDTDLYAFQFKKT